MPASNNMAAAIRKANQFGHYVAVQSVGPVGPPQTGATQDDAEHWKNVSDALIQMNANVDHFNRLDATKPATNGYAFFGGPPLDRTEVEQTSLAYVTDPTTSPPTTEPGALRGRLSVGTRRVLPAIAERGRGEARELALRHPAEPTSRHPGPTPPRRACRRGTALSEQPAYARGPEMARAKGAARVLPVRRQPPPRVRQRPPDLMEHGPGQHQRAPVTYPGKDTICNAPPTPPPADVGFSKCQFDNLVAELKTEFNWLDQVTGPKGLIATQKAALATSGDASLPDLNGAGPEHQDQPQPPGRQPGRSHPLPAAVDRGGRRGFRRTRGLGRRRPARHDLRPRQHDRLGHVRRARRRSDHDEGLATLVGGLRQDRCRVDSPGRRQRRRNDRLRATAGAGRGGTGNNLDATAHGASADQGGQPLLLRPADADRLLGLGPAVEQQQLRAGTRRLLGALLRTAVRGLPGKLVVLHLPGPARSRYERFRPPDLPLPHATSSTRRTVTRGIRRRRP